MALSLLEVGDDAILLVARSSSDVLAPAALASLGATCHHVRQLCREALAELRALHGRWRALRRKAGVRGARSVPTGLHWACKSLNGAEAATLLAGAVP